MVWFKLITRKLAVQVAQAWNFAGSAMEKVYGISIQDTLVFRDNKKTDYYVDEGQYHQYVSGLYNLLKDRHFLQTFHSDARQVLESILKEAKSKFDLQLSQQSNQDLLALYKHFILPMVEQFYIRMWTVFNIAEPLVAILHKELVNVTGSITESDKILLNLSRALEPNDILNERIDLLKTAIAREKRAVKDIQNFKYIKKLIEQHTQKYQHIPLFDFDHKPYDEDYFLKELELIKEPKKELQKIEHQFFIHRQEFNTILQQFKKHPRLCELIIFLKENVFLRDYRDMLRQKLNLELKTVYAEIGKRMELNVQQIATLTNTEIIHYLSQGKPFPLSEIKKREKAFLLIQHQEKVNFYSGNDAIKKMREEFVEKNIRNVSLIQGKIASPGITVGTARIIYTQDDLPKVKKGDIMITTMTRQDFVPFMRKIAACVTDEGGVTCHAAIISRELGIPCLVGTKVATAIFKEGEKIKVDANKGVVQKIS